MCTSLLGGDGMEIFQRHQMEWDIFPDPDVFSSIGDHWGLRKQNSKFPVTCVKMEKLGKFQTPVFCSIGGWNSN